MRIFFAACTLALAVAQTARAQDHQGPTDPEKTRQDTSSKVHPGSGDRATPPRSNAHVRARRGRKSAPQRADVDGGGKGTHRINRAAPLREEGKRIPGNAPARSTAETEQPGGSATAGIAGQAPASKSK